MTEKTPPIHEFTREGNVAGVLAELAKGVSVDTRHPSSDRTPLMEAVVSPKAGIDLVRLLIERGSNLNAVAIDKTLTTSKEAVEKIHAAIDGNTDTAQRILSLDTLKDILEKIRKVMPPGQEGIVIANNVLSLAISSGNFDKIKLLLDAGADVRYEKPHGYDALIDAMHGRNVARDSQLVPIVQLLIARGAKLNTISTYSESALGAASNNGRFDAVRVLLDAGGDAKPLQWTPLMHAIALGSLDDVKTRLKEGGELTTRDSCSRTPWLLSLQVGELAKAKLLLTTGANRSDRGGCGIPPLMYPISNGHTEMLSWLLSEGFDPNDVNEFGETPLMKAAEAGTTQCAKILIDAGADIHRVMHGEAAIKIASNLEIVRLLVSKGADLNDISDEMRAALTHLPFDEILRVSNNDYAAEKHRRFGTSNPEKMNFPFWKSMVSSGANAYRPQDYFSDTYGQDGPVWCFRRFGKSINELPDGRIIEIAGEHEDSYDPDFCIYNDVIVHHGDGTFDIYGYPKEIFPPTDFHTATLLAKFIYIIGSLGYWGERRIGETQVYRLHTDSLQIEKVNTSGQMPGWISRHKVISSGDRKIQISGGKVCVLENGKEKYEDNLQEYVLDLDTLVWSKATPCQG